MSKYVFRGNFAQPATVYWFLLIEGAIIKHLTVLYVIEQVKYAACMNGVTYRTLLGHNGHLKRILDVERLLKEMFKK